MTRLGFLLILSTRGIARAGLSVVIFSAMQNLTLPNMITGIRILLVPLIFYLCLDHQYEWVIGLSAIAFGSDFIDGKIARALQKTTSLGSVLDPVADKIVVLTFFPFFYIKGMIPFWFLLLVVVRDVAQLSSIPILNWGLKIKFKVKPAIAAKIATTIHFLIIWLLFILMAYGKNSFFGVVDIFISISLIPISAGLEVYVLLNYLPRFYQIAKGQHDTFE